MGVMQQVEARLRDELSPTHLEILNDSHMHRVEPGAESHLKAIVVSEAFAGLRAIQRHQKVYQALSVEMTLIHALSLHTYTPAEWLALDAVPKTPSCLGGGK